jgi:predicted transporter
MNRNSMTASESRPYTPEMKRARLVAILLFALAMAFILAGLFTAATDPLLGLGMLLAGAESLLACVYLPTIATNRRARLAALSVGAAAFIVLVLSIFI